MALLTPVVITSAGLRVDNALVAVNSSDTFFPDDRRTLIVNNGGGGAITVTIVTPVTFRGLAVADQPNAVSIPAAQRFEFGPFPYELYADPNTGLATVSYSGTTSVTAAIFYRPVPVG